MVAEGEIDRPLVDVVLDLAYKDETLDDNATYLVIAALESEQALRDQVGSDTGSAAAASSAVAASPDPVGAFVTFIDVAGFRGIGPRTTLELHPAPGITIVSGRNGSGKSSFAEALEFAVTGSSYRWRNKAKLWANSWRNLHHSSPTEVRVGLAVQGSAPTTVGVDWEPDANLQDHSAWTQVAGSKKEQGISRLGWGNAVELYRPILSYDEIGGLFDGGPSGLYDALAKLLGLDEIYDAEKRLTAQLKLTKAPRQAADDALKKLKIALAAATEDRAAAALALLRARQVDVDAVEQLATGTATDIASPQARLRSISLATGPDLDAAHGTANRFRDALARSVEFAEETLVVAERQSALLELALDYHAHAGESRCPVCHVGQLDDTWRSDTLAEMVTKGEQLEEFRASRVEVGAARAVLLRVIADIGVSVVPSGVDLPSSAAYQAAILDASKVPARDLELADFAEQHAAAVEEVFKLVKGEAAEKLSDHESVWTPLAADLVAWVALERTARASAGALGHLNAAKNWVSKNATDLRNLRLEPIAEQAREIWSELRQESNVDLGAITLEGRSTRRQASLQATIDGEPAGALSVMSQGELHALALALFIPRATVQRSPFRFLVLDDPIQAMDPAKVDGFVKVLSTLATTRQVIVFSHDDRLATAIRQLAVDARLVEVMRASESRVQVVDASRQARRYIDDAFAIVADDDVPEQIKRRVAPGIFRMATESAARDVYFARRYRDGASVDDVESEWLAANTTRQKLALALHSDRTASIAAWQQYRSYRRPTLAICTSGAHSGASVTLDDVRDLRRTVDDVLAIA